ncbi:MAG: hypothetical protein DMG06_05600 [Acidobacteria bacterium]|nr:MAG: hypothetical protein DMG06_05600 [Acidobacteriota bacterium]
MMHFLGKVKVWECLRCGRVFRIPESLTRASGPFTEVQEPVRDKLVVSEETSARHRTQKKGA